MGARSIAQPTQQSPGGPALWLLVTLGGVVALVFAALDGTPFPFMFFLGFTTLAAIVTQFGRSVSTRHFVFGLDGVTLTSRDARGSSTLVGPIPWDQVQSIEGDAWSVRVTVSDPRPRVLSTRRSGPIATAASFRITAPEEAQEVALSQE